MAELGLTVEAPAAAPDARIGPGWPRLARIVLLYTPDALFFGFLLTAMPYLLRVGGGGAALSTIVGYLALPLGLAFLWAPLVDRPLAPSLPRRSGWAGLCQIAAGATFAGAATWFTAAPQAAGPMTALVPSLLAAFLFATRNVALNAWMRESLPSDAVAIAIGVRCMGAAVGNWLGAGVLAGGFEELGWAGVFWALAAATIVTSLAIWRLPGQRAEAEGEANPGLVDVIREMWAKPGMVRCAAAITAVSAIMAPSVGLGLVLLADKGFTAEQLGWAAGYAGAVTTALGALAGGKLAELFGLRLMFVASAIAQALLCLGWAGFAASPAPTPFLSGATLIAAQFGLYAFMASLWMTATMRLASRERAAVELALLNALLLIAGTLVPSVAGLVADAVGELTIVFFGLAIAAAATVTLARAATPPQILD